MLEIKNLKKVNSEQEKTETGKSVKKLEKGTFEQESLKETILTEIL